MGKAFIGNFMGPTGPQGPQGPPGEIAAMPSIGSNGNWFIGERDTGVLADVDRALSAKIVASTEISEPGFIMDGKTASEKFAELNSKLSIESDSGHCIKFPDGMMIQWGSGSTANANAYREVSLYEPFVDTTYSVSIEFPGNGNTVDEYWIGDAGGNDTRRVNSFDLFLRRSTGTQYSVLFSYIAIGRWK